MDKSLVSWRKDKKPMMKIKNIEKKFCLMVGLFGLILPFITHYSCWSFGFVSGLGLAGWILLPDKEK